MVSGIASATPDVRVFKGIPYAAPPTGDQRWRAPKPAAKWEGVRKADTFSPVCMQGTNTGSEDCLYLNVWTAAKAAGEKRPVMVWIYGGGYYTGSGSQAMYDGEALAKKGAVIVTINYRLGEFGFFSYPGLDHGIRPPRGRELRRDGFDRRAAVGAEEHRGLWRRSEARHGLRRIGRLGPRCQPDDDPAVQRLVRARDR